MSIYLYVKTHNKTGLKYLGKTVSKNPYKYKGSGTHWKLHLKKHGNDVSTVILHETNSETEIKQLGLYYSNLWNIVESKQWANLKPEEGTGGGPGHKKSPTWTKAMENRKGSKPWNIGLTKHTNQSLAELSAKKSGKPAHNKGKPGKSRTRSKEELDQQVKTRKQTTGYGQTKGNKWFNNGTQELMAKESPGASWVRGRIKSIAEHMKSIASSGGKKSNHLRWGSPL
jgi:hypothetical protein